VESSGNINPQTVRAYADCGVDYVSMGYLTHSAKSLDLSLKAMK
jgi:nicotinate-nucleotide pyrophosphorylase (carboxylating)